MPELPEVETIVRQLKKKILNKTITSLEIKDEQVIDKNIKTVLPAKIKDIKRRGKNIIIDLDKAHLLIHLRMTGYFCYLNSNQNASYKNNLVGIFNFNDTSFLTHNSIRKFGSITLLSTKQLQSSLSNLGPEPLVLSKHQFVHLLEQSPRANIKNKLLDQSFIAGIGNIYAQEALYLAKINPKQKIALLSTSQKSALYHSLQKVLKLAIQNKGTTSDNYSHLSGKGNFQNFLSVYHQKNCPQNHPLTKITLGGRGTYYCPQCQR